MASTRETSIVRTITKHLKRAPYSFVLNLHGSVYQRTGLPDLMFLQYGMPPCFLEVKAPRGRVSKAQEDTMAELERAGAKVAVVRSWDGDDGAGSQLLSWGYDL